MPMSERPERGDDPDATVMIPAGGTKNVPQAAPDPDATVMQRRPDADETVMIPAAGPDPDATIAIRAQEPDPDATVAIPTPGRRREAQAAATVPASAPFTSTSPLGGLGGLNRLAEAANPILGVVAQIRHTLRHPDPAALRASLREGLDAFEQAAQAGGATEAHVREASRALCALLDDSASSTPWGTTWANEGLLAERHHETDGGPKFFAILSDAGKEPAANLDLLEFLYVCLALGFEGPYRGSESGRQELAELRAQLRRRISEYRPAYDGELSARWRGIAAPVRRAPAALAFWAVACGAALLLAAVYLGFSLTLSGRSDPVARELAQLKVVAPARPAAAAGAATAATLGISAQLAPEIGRGEVAVTDAAGQSTIVIRSDRFFASGSARLERDVEPVILRIAEALDRVPGTILVTGHTDDVPIRTARFPSNWELSTERAASVVKLVAAKLREPARLRTEGLADSEPVAPNDSGANRARNRRVVIILRSAP
jgi:type VI secretion system protein ImpK